MRQRLIISGILLIIAVLYINGCQKAGSWLVKDDKPVYADAMVILMGSIPDRVLQASDLFNKGITGKIIIVEENMDGYKALENKGLHIQSETEIAFDALISLGIPSDRITVLPGYAKSTTDEALIIRKFISDNHSIKNLLLVSSSAHTRRASIIFKFAFKKTGDDIAVYSSPSAYSSFNSGKWWKNKDDIQTVLLEYLKLANFELFDKHNLDILKK